MLEVILKRELDHCAAVVVRYYGGRKLGVGGLARAYGGAVARALDAAGVRDVVDTLSITVRAPFASVDAVLRELPGADAGFDARGLVATLTIETAAREDLERRLATLTRGEAVVEVRSS
jgi:putative IMPACT (imprinted ancient) family translation regulator